MSKPDPVELVQMRLAIAAVAMHGMLVSAPASSSEELAEVADAHAAALMRKVLGPLGELP